MTATSWNTGVSYDVHSRDYIEDIIDKLQIKLFEMHNGYNKSQFLFLMNDLVCERFYDYQSLYTFIF